MWVWYKNIVLWIIRIDINKPNSPIRSCCYFHYHIRTHLIGVERAVTYRLFHVRVRFTFTLIRQPFARIKIRFQFRKLLQRYSQFTVWVKNFMEIIFVNTIENENIETQSLIYIYIWPSLNLHKNESSTWFYVFSVWFLFGQKWFAILTRDN